MIELIPEKTDILLPEHEIHPKPPFARLSKIRSTETTLSRFRSVSVLSSAVRKPGTIRWFVMIVYPRLRTKDIASSLMPCTRRSTY